jgi:hypothetical protein
MLCESCKDTQKAEAPGNCCSCKSRVASSSYQLCAPCAKTRGQCRCCRAGMHLLVTAGSRLIGQFVRFV